MERYDVLLKSIKNGGALYAVVYVVCTSEPEDGALHEPLFTDCTLWENLRDASVARIRAASDDGGLWMDGCLEFIVFQWVKWTTREEVGAAIGACLAKLKEPIQEDEDGFVEYRDMRKMSIGNMDALASRFKLIVSCDTDRQAVSVAEYLLGCMEAPVDGDAAVG